MTDVFQTGTFFHPQDLWDQLDPLIQSAGWTVQATPHDGYDRVYFSDGEDGYQLNYVRMAHRQQDELRTSRGFVQTLDADGYSDYVNFFAYQWFPSGGGDGDGYGEIGVFGPRLYSVRGSTSSEIQWSNWETGTAGSPRWTNFASNLPVTAGPDRHDSGENTDVVFDGHRFVYYNTGDSLEKFDIATNTTTASVSTGVGTKSGPLCLSYNREDETYSIVYLTNIATSGQQAGRWTFDRDDNLITSTAIENTPWTGDSDHGAGAAIGRYYYMFKGDNTTSCAYYDIVTNSWTSLTAFPSAGFELGGDALITTRQESGVANHRLWAYQGHSSTNFDYMNLTDEGLPDGGGGGTWNSAAALPVSANEGARMWWVGTDKIFYNPGVNGGTDREVYEYDIPGNSWSLVDSTGIHSSRLTGSGSKMHYSLQSRVRAFVNEEQQYWLFANKNKIIVVTKSAAGRYTHCYAGTLDSFFNDQLQTTTTASASAGANVTIPVSSTDGFSIGQDITILAADNSLGSISNSMFDGRTRKYLHADRTQITDINVGVSLELGALNADYPSGSVIGPDVQNMVLSVEATRYCQTLNFMNDPANNTFASGDVPESVYVCEPSVASQFTALADASARTEQFIVWPFLVFTEAQAGTTLSGKEVRGQLRDVFIAGDSVGESEDIINVNGTNYLIFKISRQEETRFFAFGPVV